MSTLRNVYFTPRRDLDISINKQREIIERDRFKSSSGYIICLPYLLPLYIVDIWPSPSQFSGTKAFQRLGQERNYKYHLQLCIHSSNSVLAKSY